MVSTRGCGSPRCRAWTSTANPIRSASRAPASSTTASTCSSCSPRGRRPSRSRRPSACAWPASWPSAATSSTSCTTTRAWAPVCSTSPQLGLPVVATVHHPITRDRVLDVAAAKWWRKPLVRRWYGFAEMQKQVARKLPELLTVSSTSATDIAEDFGVSPDQLHVVPLGVDTELFKPAEHRVRNRIVAIASADVPLKGVSHLLHAVARLRVERDLELQLVSKLEPNGPTEKLIAELGISDIVHSSSGICPTSNSPRCCRRPRWPASRRCTRASRCPPWRRWPAARRSSPAAPGRCPRWSASTASARGSFIPATSTN